MCDAKKNGVNIDGITGYSNLAYGISNVNLSSKRYMGPLHIIVNSERCGWNKNIGGVIHETLSLLQTELYLVVSKALENSVHKLEDVNDYLYKKDGSELNNSIISTIISSEPLKCPVTSYESYSDFALTTVFINNNVIHNNKGDTSLS